MKSIFSIGVLLFANPFTYATPLNLVAPSNRQLTSLYASSVNRPISNPSPQVWNSPPRPNPSIPASSGVAITKPNDLTQKPLRIAQDGTEPATILNWDDAVKRTFSMLSVTRTRILLINLVRISTINIIRSRCQIRKKVKARLLMISSLS